MRPGDRTHLQPPHEFRQVLGLQSIRKLNLPPLVKAERLWF